MKIIHYLRTGQGLGNRIIEKTNDKEKKEDKL